MYRQIDLLSISMTAKAIEYAPFALQANTPAPATLLTK
jgi:hypothetical protein